MNIAVPPSYIIDYLHRKLPDYKMAGLEFRASSLLTNDDKYKLYVNSQSGQWMDFKAHQGGNFWQLVSILEGCSIKAAKKMVMSHLWDNGLEFESPDIKQKLSQDLEIDYGKLAEEIKNFKNVSPTSYLRSGIEGKAGMFLKNRSLPSDKFMYAFEGKYANRLIIPFLSADGSIPFFQARTLFNSKIKYLNPGSKDYGIKASDLLYPFNFDMSYVVVTEGPIDAITLQTLGFNATSTQGSNLSTIQARMLSGDRKVVLSYDNDEAGNKGVRQARNALLIQRHSNISFVRPPTKFKDWNDYLIQAGGPTVISHICRSVEDGFSGLVTSGLLE